MQSIVSSFLYCARALDYTLLLAINETSVTQVKPTFCTLEQCYQILDCAATCPDACLRYHACDMVLMIDSGNAYLVMPQAKSRIAGYYHLSDHPKKTPHPTINSAILVECKALKHVVSSSAEAEKQEYFITHRLLHQLDTHLRNSTIIKQLHLSKSTTPQKQDSFIRMHTRRDLNRGTCVIIG